MYSNSEKIVEDKGESYILHEMRILASDEVIIKLYPQKIYCIAINLLLARAFDIFLLLVTGLMQFY